MARGKNRSLCQPAQCIHSNPPDVQKPRRGDHGGALLVTLYSYRSRLRTFWLLWLAWSSIAVDAWLRTCALASSFVALDQSVSSLRERASERLATFDVRLLTVACR